MMTDRLRWWEEIPLGLALLAQSYVVGLWYFASIKGASQEADLMVAIGAGLALDLIVVTTVMGRRQGRSSGWSWATSFGAFGCSSAIALDRYGWEWRSLLHVAFPLVVFLYSQHLATPSKAISAALPLKRSLWQRLRDWLDRWRSKPSDQRSEGAQERSASTEGPEAPSPAPAQLSAPVSAAHNHALFPPSAPLEGGRSSDQALSAEAVVALDRYPCPHCGRALASGRAVGAAKTNGYCQHCKHERSAA